MKQHYQIIGLMSGTSLDGLDIAFCRFEDLNPWHYEIIAAETIAYDKHWRERLQNAPSLSGEDLAKLDADLGHWTAQQVARFRANHPGEVDAIAHHGHTVFHQPHRGFTLQIGDASAISTHCQLPCVAQFRTNDVALGGQGAPLVPIGDALLFKAFDVCLNLGGIANHSYEHLGQRLAYDIGPCNMVLNHFAQVKGFDYDVDGHLATQGHVDSDVLTALDRLDYFQLHGPKSLGYEWVHQHYIPCLCSFDLSPEDALANACEHIALSIEKACPSTATSLLVTGGGAFNRHLIQRIESKLSFRVEIPDKSIVNYKEALIFAFLGLLRLLEKPNSLSEVTGARRNSIGGAVYLP